MAKERAREKGREKLREFTANFDRDSISNFSRSRNRTHDSVFAHLFSVRMRVRWVEHIHALRLCVCACVLGGGERERGRERRGRAEYINIYTITIRL